jgi:outer membrane immunogenic protein
MKKLVLALSAIAAFTGPVLAADMATKAPMRAAPLPVASWTGCYIAGGGGYGLFDVESREVDRVTGATVAFQGDTGGRGWMGQVGGGCDYQFAGPLGNWVVGILGDYTFSDVKGDHVGAPFTSWVSRLKEDNSWAVGGRIGYLVSPTFLTYFSGGYTESHFKSSIATNFVTGLPATPSFALQSANYQGWFLGSGFEYGLGFLPGLYLKTEYRFSEFDRKQLNVVNTAGTIVATENLKPFTQSVITSLVYRFNWGGVVGPRY